MDYDIVAGVGPNGAGGRRGQDRARGGALLRRARRAGHRHRRARRGRAAAARADLRCARDAGSSAATRSESFLAADLIVRLAGRARAPSRWPRRAQQGVRDHRRDRAGGVASSRRRIVGVTGTNGKSTTTALAGAIAAATGPADLRRRQPGHAAHRGRRHAGGDGRAGWSSSSCRAFSSRPPRRSTRASPCCSTSRPITSIATPASTPTARPSCKLVAQPRRRRRRGGQRRRPVLLGRRRAAAQTHSRAHLLGAAPARRRPARHRRRRSTAATWWRSASAIPSASCTWSAATTSATRWPRSCSARQRARHLRRRCARPWAPSGRCRTAWSWSASGVGSVLRRLQGHQRRLGRRRPRRLPAPLRADRRRARQGRLLRAAGRRAARQPLPRRGADRRGAPTRSPPPSPRRRSRVRRARATPGGRGRARRACARSRATRSCCRRPAQLLRHVPQLRASRPRLPRPPWRRC